jgi:hypothetical protein
MADYWRRQGDAELTELEERNAQLEVDAATAPI